MSRTTIRATAVVAIALSLAGFAWPAAADDDTGGLADPVPAAARPERAALETDVRSPGAVLRELSEAIAEDIAVARHTRHLEAVAIWQAAEAERLWIEGERAAEARRAEDIWRADEARRAEEQRRAEERAAAASAPAGSLEAIIQRHFGPAASEAIRIADCESGMNPNAVSPTNDHGLFQINAVHRGQFEAVTGAPWSSVYDPELNTIYARYLYGQQGWSPWTCA